MDTGLRAVASLAAGALAAAGLAACATSTPRAPRAHSGAERQWIDNAARFIGTLDSDVLLSANGGANLASARRALSDDSALTAMLVAYSLFGGCRPALGNVGVPTARVGSLVRTLVSACGRLERAAALFERAVRASDPRLLLRATRLVLDTTPLLYHARSQLHGLGS